MISASVSYDYDKTYCIYFRNNWTFLYDYWKKQFLGTMLVINRFHFFLWKWPATSECVWSEPSYYISINFRRHHFTTLYIRTLGPRLLRDPRYYIWRKMLCDASKHGVVVVGRKHHITLIREKIKWIISISNGTLGCHGST